LANEGYTRDEDKDYSDFSHASKLQIMFLHDIFNKWLLFCASLGKIKFVGARSIRRAFYLSKRFEVIFPYRPIFRDDQAGVFPT
jgi:hypothetical protein